MFLIMRRKSQKIMINIETLMKNLSFSVNEKHPLHGQIKNREGAIFDAFYCSPTLTIMFPGALDSEIEAVRNGDVKANVIIGDEIVLLVEFDDILAEAPFNINLYNGEVSFDEYEIDNDSKGLYLLVVLVDTETGLVKVIRGITLDNDVSRLLVNAAKRQYIEK